MILLLSKGTILGSDGSRLYIAVLCVVVLLWNIIEKGRKKADDWEVIYQLWSEGKFKLKRYARLMD